MEASFEYVFPAISGVQAQREYYVSMCSLRLMPKIFLFDEEELVPELRAQRTLNKARLPALCRYILDNTKIIPLLDHGLDRRSDPLRITREKR